MKEKQVAGIIDLDDTEEKKKKVSYEQTFTVLKSKKSKSKSKKDAGVDANLGYNISYANPPTAMEKLYALYIEDETIGASIDKTARVASSEDIIIDNQEGSRNKQNIATAKEIIKQCYMVIKKNEDGVVSKKKILNKEFFKYLFTDVQIYNNGYFEVLRSLDGAKMAFVRKDPRKIRVLKDHLGFVEIDGINKYFYNNYSPYSKERANFRIHYKKGYIKNEKETITAPNKREIIHIRGYGNEYYGISQLYSLGASSLLQLNAKTMPNNLMGNGMINTPIINFSGTEVSDPNKKEIENKMKYRATGNKNAGKVIILYSTAPNSKVEVKGMPRHEFKLEDARIMYKLGESNVIKRMGIPPEKVSILEHSNKATIEGADATMVEDIINPMQSLFEYQMEVILNDDLKLNVTFKFSDKFYNMELVSKVSRTAVGLSVNDIRTRLFKISPSEDPNADEILIPQTAVPLSGLVAGETVTKDKIYKDAIKYLHKIRKSYDK